MKKVYFSLFILSSVLAFAQFGSKVKFSPENKIKYGMLKKQLDSDFEMINQKIDDQKQKLKSQDGSQNYINYQPLKDSLCDAYVYQVSKLVDPDQIEYFWKIVNRRMKRSKETATNFR